MYVLFLELSSDVQMKNTEDIEGTNSTAQIEKPEIEDTEGKYLMQSLTG